MEIFVFNSQVRQQHIIPSWQKNCTLLILASILYILHFIEKTWINISNKNVKPELMKKQVILHEL